MTTQSFSSLNKKLSKQKSFNQGYEQFFNLHIPLWLSTGLLNALKAKSYHTTAIDFLAPTSIQHNRVSQKYTKFIPLFILMLKVHGLLCAVRVCTIMLKFEYHHRLDSLINACLLKQNKLMFMGAHKYTLHTCKCVLQHFTPQPLAWLIAA